MPKYYGCPCEGCAKPLTLKDDIVVCPDCGAPYHRDCYEKLEELNAIFNNVDSKANPLICSAVSRHLLARGIRQVVFDKLDSAESDEDDYIRVSLNFTEHNPPIVRTEKEQAKTPTPSELKEQANAEKVKSEAKDVIQVDLN